MTINVGSAFAYAFLTTLGTNGGMGIPKARGTVVLLLLLLLAMAVTAPV